MKRMLVTTAVLVTAATVLAADPPSEIIAVATDTGIVAVFDKANANQPYATFDPFPSTNAVNLAAGDFNGDGRDDVVAACDGSVRVLTTGGVLLKSFLPYPGYSGAVRVAAGDVTGDGRADIVTGTGPGPAGGPVKVFDGVSGALVWSFLSQSPSFTGGVFVAAGDIDGDGKADLIVGSDSGLVPAVKVFNGATLALHASFFAYDAGFTGGVRVAIGDVNGDGKVDIVTGAGPGAPGGHVKVFDGRSLATLASFDPFESTYTGGVHVAGGSNTMTATPSSSAGFATIRIFAAGGTAQWLMPFPGYKGGLTVAQSPGALGKAPSRPRIPSYNLTFTW